MDLQSATDLLDRLQGERRLRVTRASDRDTGPQRRGGGPGPDYVQPVDESPALRPRSFFTRAYLAGNRPAVLVRVPFHQLPWSPMAMGLSHDFLHGDGEPDGPLVHGAATHAAHKWDPATRPNMRSRLGVVDAATAPATPQGAHAVLVGALVADRLATHLDVLGDSLSSAQQSRPWRREASVYRGYVSTARAALDALTAPWADDVAARATTTETADMPTGFARVGTT